MYTYAKQQLKTLNDRNGNPRRVWILYEMTETEAYARVFSIRDEGYRGMPTHNLWGKAVILPSVEISAKEYNRLLNTWVETI